MSSNKTLFKGKDVSEAINNACQSLGVPQEQLDIEVLKTGSAGIFGLIRPKALIKVSLKNEVALEDSRKTPKSHGKRPGKKKGKSSSPAPSFSQSGKTSQQKDESATAKSTDLAESIPEISTEKTNGKPKPQIDEKISPDVLNAIKEEISRMLDIMGMSSEVSITHRENSSIDAYISGNYIDSIIGPEGRTLDSLQYLLRKIFSKKYSFKIALSLDAGNFRANRMKDLKSISMKMASEVKKTGKARSIPSLNPSERRIVHMALEEDKNIRSRSVGDGLFKKVLIYLPAKGKKSGPRKRKSTKSNKSKVAESVSE